MSGESSGTYQTDEEYMAEWEKRYARFRRRVPGEPILATIARLSYMVNGQIGRDWRSGVAFTLHDKGDDFTAIQDAVAALQEQRAEVSRLQQQLSDCKSSLRAVEATIQACNQRRDTIDAIKRQEAETRAEAAEAREKQLRAETFRSAAEFAERDTDWSAFARQSKPDWKTGDETNVFALPRDPDDTMPTDANVFAYRIGIATGRAIAAGLRALASKEGGNG